MYHCAIRFAPYVENSLGNKLLENDTLLLVNSDFSENVRQMSTMSIVLFVRVLFLVITRDHSISTIKTKKLKVDKQVSIFFFMNISVLTCLD